MSLFQTLNHIAEYDRNARDLLVQSIRMNLQEIQKHPEPVRFLAF